MMLVSPAVIMFLLALEYGGNQYAWNSSVVIGLLVGATVTFAIFLVWEHRQSDGAMIPFAMMKKPRHQFGHSHNVFPYVCYPCGRLLPCHFLPGHQQ
jgi:xanthine/uracil permease